MLHRETVSPSTLDLLVALCAHPMLANFALAGGTSLALRFGHRTSIDLDFFTAEPFDNEALVDSLKKNFPFEERRRGTTGVGAIVDGVIVDFVKYRYQVVHPPEIVEDIRLMSLPDVIAMKLSAITNRGAKKDFYDLHTLIAELGLPHLVECYRQKFPATDPMMLFRSLTYFADAEDEDEPQSFVGATWAGVKKGIQKAVQTALK